MRDHDGQVGAMKIDSESVLQFVSAIIDSQDSGVAATNVEKASLALRIESMQDALSRIEMAIAKADKNATDGVNASNGYLHEMQRSLFEIENLIADELKRKNKGDNNG